MKKYTLILILLFTSCKEKLKQSDFQQSDIVIALYNDVLIDLVENYYYNRYLGKDGEILMKEFYNNMGDTLKLSKDKLKFHNSLFGDTLRFKTIYLKDTIIGKNYHRSNFNHYKSDENNIFARILKKSLINKIALIDTINQIQLNCKAKLFHADTFKIRSVTDQKRNDSDSSIGIVSFSKIYFFNKDSEGVFSCDFTCGGLCGKGYIIHVKKIKDRWKIVERSMTWIS